MLVGLRFWPGIKNLPLGVRRTGQRWLLSYQLIPNLIFISSIAGFLLMIARRFPQSLAEEQKSPPLDEKLLRKGLPIIGVSKTLAFFKVRRKKVWDFMLEAKDLKHSPLTGYRIKKIFSNQPIDSSQPTPIIQLNEQTKTEQELLDIIKRDPHSLANYDQLGKYYISQESFKDAEDIYQYLISHRPTESDYYAKLAYCNYKEKNFTSAVEQYQKSLDLDSTQPSRYYNLGLSLDASGNSREAARALRQAILLESDNKKFYTAISKIYTKLGDRAKAKEALQKATQL